ncbi:ADP-ribosylation/Crystallin J1 [Infundibulicybe gibba]|nr:ADP-ribosylation/Crystallin J1 [Infundibulicybe gibba]
MNPPAHLEPLHSQYPTIASPATKIRLSILSTALVDALGGPPEFHQRFSFPLITSMMPNRNFSLPKGVWTDDTSMTLCLAHSLATYSPPAASGSQSRAGGFDEKHQLDAYNAWHDCGELSAIGLCFDIGNTINQALFIYSSSDTPEKGIQAIRASLSGDVFGGNGSLMRILPVGLAYWRDDQTAREYARRSSQTTHPNNLCLEACEVWTGAIVRVMQDTANGCKKLTKLGLLQYFATFPYTNEKLRQALAVPSTSPTSPPNDQLEEYYRIHHPILKLIVETQKEPGQKFSKIIPQVKDLPSSGYVLHTLVAALYCFLATDSFEEGAIMAINLGNDADTVGAVYAGLAGCWYAGEEAADNGLFWTWRVREWKGDLVKRDMVEKVADELVVFSEQQIS